MDEEQEQNRLEEAALAVQIAVLCVLLRRLRKLTPDTTYAMARALEAQDMAEVERLLEQGRGLVAERAGEVVEGAAAECDEWAAPFYAAAGKVQVPALEGMASAQAVRSAKAGAEKEIRRLCDSTVLQLVANDGRLVPFRQEFRTIVDGGIQALTRGDDVFYEFVGKTAERLGKTGLKVRYESGTTRDLYSALAQNVMDTAARAQADIREIQGREFGADGYAVSAHPYCAKDHLEYQGREFSKAEFESVQRGLRRPFGKWNCRHLVTPVILGVSPRFYTAKERAGFREQSTRKTGVLDSRGRDMTAYEFTQWQRQRETSIRKLRAAAYLNDAAGVDSAKIKAKAKELEADYFAKSKAAKIKDRRERMRVFVIE